MAIGRINATLTGVQPGGLAKIVPTSVAVGSGSGSVDSNGNVTFSGASSISLNGIFSSAYQNYKILFESVASAQQDVWGRMRVNGTDLSSGVYGIASLNVSNSTVANLYSPSGYTQTSVYFGNTFSAAKFVSSIEFFRPNQADNTQLLWQGSTMSTNPWSFHGANSVNNTTVYDSFTFWAGTGTFTGTVRVYGYTQ